MTTRAREVEAWLRTEAEDERSWSGVPAHLSRAKRFDDAADVISSLIAECETAKADLAEAVKVMEPFAKAADELKDTAEDHEGVMWDGITALANAGDLRAARAFIARHPQPVPVGEEKP